MEGGESLEMRHIMRKRVNKVLKLFIRNSNEHGIYPAHKC